MSIIRIRLALDALAAGVLVCILSGCVGLRPVVTGDSAQLHKPGALVEVQTVKNSSGQTFDVDVDGMLRTAMQEALQSEQLQWTSGSNHYHFVLDLSITEYRQGNAFQRWLLPGYGSTVLAVKGTVKDAGTGAVVVSILHQRSIEAGGFYTIGAWKYIFSSVASDIARDLKIRIEQGRQFVVYLTPRADQAPAPQPSERAIKIKLAEIVDERQDKGRIGTRTAAFEVSMGDVFLGQNVDDAVLQALRDDLLVAGFQVVKSGQDLTVEGHLQKFWIHTDTTMLYWDVVGEIKLKLIITPVIQVKESVQKTFMCYQVNRTYVWPSTALLGKVLDKCVADLMMKVRTDAVWKQESSSKQIP